MNTVLLAMLLGFGIGAALGMLGGGGSILTVPALVYLIGLTPQVAVTTSLAIVGANSTLGVFIHQAQGTLNWRVALMFGGAGVAISYMAAGLSRYFPPMLLMVAFALLMLFVGAMLLSRRSEPDPSDTPTSLTPWKILLAGAGVGLLTGILGVGGGFLIVPALVMLVGLPMHQAVGTSLLVIAMNSAAGFLGHIEGITLDIRLIVAFVAAGILGTFAGARLGRRLDAYALRRVFAIFVIGLALVLLYDNLPKLLMGR